MEVFLFYEMGKKQRKSKERVVYVRGNVCVLLCSPEVWERPQAHGLECPSLRRNTLALKTPPTILWFFSGGFFSFVF
jgi:hypothetical protein